jgi:short-subunit dehydrogenase
MVSLAGKVILITGASSGIGAASAVAFGRAGAHTVVAARRLDRLQNLAGQIESLGTGAQALPVAADLSRLSDIVQMVETARDRFGRIDVLLNNAGFGRLGWLESLDPQADIENQLAVNLLATIQTTRQVLPLMLEQRSGHIINMSSVAGLIGPPTYTVYAASKFALRGFSEALRREVAPFGIHVSVIYPGGVATEFGAKAGIQRRTRITTPDWLRLSPDDVGRAVVGLARRPRRSLVIPSVARVAVYANLLAPWLVDWIVVKALRVANR